MKRILITGANSYIGTSLEKWLNHFSFNGRYQIDTVDMQENEWQQMDFSRYDTVFHVAGIAHADVGKITDEQKKMYYKINCNLALDTAKKAKESGVKQFIYMSSIIVYGEGTLLERKRVITKNTAPNPSNFYGDSKWKAEQKLAFLEEDAFRIAILRPPMIYGKGSKGNYPLLAQLTRKLPIFPDINNERSMLFIENLCEFLRLLIDNGCGGTFFPQNADYVKTSEMVNLIATAHMKKIKLTMCMNWAIYLLGYFPGKAGRMVNKAFGNLVYARSLSDSSVTLGNYQLFNTEKSIQMTEKGSAK